METMMLWALGGTLATLLAVLAWTGNRVHSRLDQINQTLTEIHIDLMQRINQHDVRLAVLEAKAK